MAKGLPFEMANAFHMIEKTSSGLLPPKFVTCTLLYESTTVGGEMMETPCWCHFEVIWP